MKMIQCIPEEKMPKKRLNLDEQAHASLYSKFSFMNILGKSLKMSHNNRRSLCASIILKLDIGHDTIDFIRNFKTRLILYEAVKHRILFVSLPGQSERYLLEAQSLSMNYQLPSTNGKHNTLSRLMTKPTRRLIRVFAERSMGRGGPNVSSCGGRRL